MDPDGNIIPIVEDDMGEGFTDEVPPELYEKLVENQKLSDRDPIPVGKLSEAEKDPELKKQLKSWEKRIEKRSDHIEQQPDLPGPSSMKEEGVKVRWIPKLMKDQNVYLMVGTEGNNAIQLYAQPYRVSGARDNGKLILKPLKTKGPMDVKPSG